MGIDPAVAGNSIVLVVAVVAEVADTDIALGEAGIALGAAGIGIDPAVAVAAGVVDNSIALVAADFGQKQRWGMPRQTQSLPPTRF